MTNRRCPCSSKPCALTPNAEGGASRRRSKKSAPGPRPARVARNCCALPVEEKSTSSSFGGSIAGGRSLVDLVSTLQEVTALNVGFVSLSEALDLTTPAGRAFAGMLAVFAEFERDILRDRVKAGIAQARKDGRPHGRPAKIAGKATQIRELAQNGLSKSAIAKQLKIGRTSVRRSLANP